MPSADSLAGQQKKECSVPSLPHRVSICNQPVPRKLQYRHVVASFGISMNR
jgi:hypothetical protein